jgi:hypothetical protein
MPVPAPDFVAASERPPPIAFDDGMWTVLVVPTADVEEIEPSSINASSVNPMTGFAKNSVAAKERANRRKDMYVVASGT